jgi:hypothetical protein
MNKYLLSVGLSLLLISCTDSTTDEDCTPQTCIDDLGKSCGNWDDGCGSTITCGPCSTGTCDTVAGTCDSNSSPAVILFSDMTDGPTTGWEGSTEKGAAISIWVRNISTNRGESYVTVGEVDLTSDSDYAEWGVTTNPTVPLGIQRITFFLNSSMNTLGNFPNSTIRVTTPGGTSSTIPFHCRALGSNYIYFVDNVNGDDGNLGTTVAQAKKSTGWARGNLEAGDVCYLKGSSTAYTDHDHGISMFHRSGLFTFGGGTSPNHNNGEEGKSITVTAYPGENVKLEGIEKDEVGLNSCITMYYAGSQLSYWTFSKFTMEAARATVSLGGTGYTNGGTSNIRIIGNDMTTVMTDINQWGNIVIAYGNGHGMDHLFMYGNFLHDQCADYRGQDTGRRVYQVYIGGYGALDHIYVGWNDMGWGSQGRGFQVYGHHHDDTLDNFHVHNNYFHHNARQNVILGGGDDGGAVEYSFVKNAYFYNNIVADPHDDDVAILVGGVGHGRNGGNFYIYNNIFFRENSYPTMNVTKNVESIEFVNNIIISAPNAWDYFTYHPDFDNPDTSMLHGESNIYYGAGNDAAPSWDSSTLRDNNPLFSEELPSTYEDFMPLSNSPTVDNGNSSVLPIVTTDFIGIERTADYVDIGAFEFNN